eukprot:1321012-Rhodomonas_salina.1
MPGVNCTAVSSSVTRARYPVPGYPGYNAAAILMMVTLASLSVHFWHWHGRGDSGEGLPGGTRVPGYP